GHLRAIDQEDPHTEAEQGLRGVLPEGEPPHGREKAGENLLREPAQVDTPHVYPFRELSGARARALQEVSRELPPGEVRLPRCAHKAHLQEEVGASAVRTARKK